MSYKYCRCGSSQPPASKSVSLSSCGQDCPGDTNEKCGDWVSDWDSKWSVYTVGGGCTKTTTTTTMTTTSTSLIIFTTTSTTASAPITVPWRADNKCGPLHSNSAGNPAQCDPNSDWPCCHQDNGWCGITNEHCNCSQCVDYRNSKFI